MGCDSYSLYSASSLTYSISYFSKLQFAFRRLTLPIENRLVGGKKTKNKEADKLAAAAGL